MTEPRTKSTSQNLPASYLNFIKEKSKELQSCEATIRTMLISLGIAVFYEIEHKAKTQEKNLIEYLDGALSDDFFIIGWEAKLIRKAHSKDLNLAEICLGLIKNLPKNKQQEEADKLAKVKFDGVEE